MHQQHQLPSGQRLALHYHYGRITLHRPYMHSLAVIPRTPTVPAVCRVSAELVSTHAPPRPPSPLHVHKACAHGAVRARSPSRVDLAEAVVPLARVISTAAAHLHRPLGAVVGGEPRAGAAEPAALGEEGAAVRLGRG